MKQVLDYSSLLANLPKRKLDSHKGDYGRVLILGGNEGMAGAPLMAAVAAYRTGAGLVKVLTRPSHVSLITAYAPEVQVLGQALGESITPYLNWASVIVVGPGLGEDAWARDMWASALLSDVPMVVDADALRLLAAERSVSSRWVLTPHAGEAAALLGSHAEAVQVNREASVRALQLQYHGVVVLKGHHTLLSCPQGGISVCEAGNPGMATAGMGDVLSGVIAALLAQGLSLSQAAQLGVCLHAKAADEVAKHNGQVGMMATDLFPYLRAAVNGR